MREGGKLRFMALCALCWGVFGLLFCCWQIWGTGDSISDRAVIATALIALMFGAVGGTLLWDRNEAAYQRHLHRDEKQRVL